MKIKLIDFGLKADHHPFHFKDISAKKTAGSPAVFLYTTIFCYRFGSA